MRILVDINHPHQVHVFRNAIRLWKLRGDDVLISARDKDLTTKLLDLYGLEFSLTSRPRKAGVFNFARGVIETDLTVWQLARRFKPDWLIGTSFAAAHISRLSKARSIVIAEDSFESSKMFWKITAPFADFIVTPSSIVDDYGTKHIKYDGYQELAYLHPNQFSPDKRVLKEHGLKDNDVFFILRFVSLNASHDLGQAGLSDTAKKKLVQLLSSYGRVFITSEQMLSDELSPYRLSINPTEIHDLLAYATLLVTDSQSMTIEAAVLGTPSIRSNSFVGRTPVIEELEKKYELTSSFSPTEHEKMFARVKELLSFKSLKLEWEDRRQKMLAEKIDVTEWLLSLPERL